MALQPLAPRPGVTQVCHVPALSSRHPFHPTTPRWIQRAALVQKKQTGHLFAQCQPPAIPQWAMGCGVVGLPQPIHAAGRVWACKDNNSSLPLTSFGGCFFPFFFFFYFSFFSAFYGAYPTGIAEYEFRCRLWASLGLNPHKKGTKEVGEKHKAPLLQALRR